MICRKIMLGRLFTRGDTDAESALIKSILERNKFTYTVHDILAENHAQAFRRLCGNATAPLLLVGRHIKWTATELPQLEASGELVKILKRERERRIARDEYRWGRAYLEGEGGVRRDPFVAFEWMRRSARRGDPKGQAALATLLASGDAGVVDEVEAARWFEASAQGGCRSGLLGLGSLRLRQAERQPEGAQNRLAAAVHAFKRAAELGSHDAYVWIAQSQARLDALHSRRGGAGGSPGGVRGVRGGGGGGGGGAAELSESFHGGGSFVKKGGGDDGSSKQRRRALYWRAASSGSAEGAFWLAHSLSHGRLPPSAHATLTPDILRHLATAATGGHAAALYVLGCAVLLGHAEPVSAQGGAPDATGTAMVAAPSAAADEPTLAPLGPRRLTIASDVGGARATSAASAASGAPVDVNLVVTWWVESARGGHAAAMAAIGQALLDGLGAIRVGQSGIDHAGSRSEAASREAIGRRGSGGPRDGAEAKGRPRVRSLSDAAARLARHAAGEAGARAMSTANGEPMVSSIDGQERPRDRAANAVAAAEDVAAAPSPTASQLVGALRSAASCAPHTPRVITAAKQPSAERAATGRPSLLVAPSPVEAAAAGSRIDSYRAYDLFEAAAQKGDASGMVGLGDCHLLGTAGVRAELLVAVAWYARRGAWCYVHDYPAHARECACSCARECAWAWALARALAWALARASHPPALSPLPLPLSHAPLTSTLHAPRLPLFLRPAGMLWPQPDALRAPSSNARPFRSPTARALCAAPDRSSASCERRWAAARAGIRLQRHATTRAVARATRRVCAGPARSFIGACGTARCAHWSRWAGCDSRVAASPNRPTRPPRCLSGPPSASMRLERWQWVACIGRFAATCSGHTCGCASPTPSAVAMWRRD